MRFSLAGFSFVALVFSLGDLSAVGAAATGVVEEGVLPARVRNGTAVEVVGIAPEVGAVATGVGEELLLARVRNGTVAEEEEEEEEEAAAAAAASTVVMLPLALPLVAASALPARCN